jgi:hypothetical protein
VRQTPLTRPAVGVASFALVCVSAPATLSPQERGEGKHRATVRQHALNRHMRLAAMRAVSLDGRAVLALAPLLLGEGAFDAPRVEGG